MPQDDLGLFDEVQTSLDIVEVVETETPEDGERRSRRVFYTFYLREIRKALKNKELTPLDLLELGDDYMGIYTRIDLQ